MSESPKRKEALLFDRESDRRQISRKSARTTFVVGSISGHLVDMSESGLGLEAQQALPVLKKGTFTLEIGKARPQFRGQVRWCRLTGTAASQHGETVPVYRAGIAIFGR